MKNSMESQYILLQFCDYLHIIENVCVRLYNHISLSGTWLRLTCEHSWQQYGADMTPALSIIGVYLGFDELQ